MIDTQVVLAHYCPRFVPKWLGFKGQARKGASMSTYKIGINFVPGHEVVLEDSHTEVICRVVAVRRNNSSIFYDLVPLQLHSEKNVRGLSIGRQFTVGIRLDSVDGASWGLRDA